MSCLFQSWFQIAWNAITWYQFPSILLVVGKDLDWVVAQHLINFLFFGNWSKSLIFLRFPTTWRPRARGSWPGTPSAASTASWCPGCSTSGWPDSTLHSLTFPPSWRHSGGKLARFWACWHSQQYVLPTYYGTELKLHKTVNYWIFRSLLNCELCTSL